ncbi:MAG: nucleotidyl transferase, partial [Thermoleophilia bacterium]|nr:nucleotidyl transferase [Thermoleophilia bacterium]
HGFRRFLLLTGYRGEMIAGFAGAERWPGGVAIECLPTGEETPTGGRLALAADRLGGDTFAVAYSDGVADIDLGAALARHRGGGAAATMALVRPRSQWGVAMVDDDDRVRGFVEKPRMEQWVNAGFMFLEPAALGYVGRDSVLEREPLERLAAAGELGGFRHEGFWDCMDTYKDAVMLNDLWRSGAAPWRIWETAAVG